MLFFRRDRLPSRSRRGLGLRLRTRTIDGHHRHGFAMPVKENFAAVLKLRHWLNPVGWMPGWQSCRRSCAVPPSGADRAGGAGGHCDFTRPDEVCYWQYQALVLFAVAPLLSGITARGARRMRTTVGLACPQEYRDLFKLLSPPERGAGCRRLGLPPDAVRDGRRDDHRHRAAGGDGGLAAACTWGSDYAVTSLPLPASSFCYCGPRYRQPVYRYRRQPRGDAGRWSNRSCCWGYGWPRRSRVPPHISFYHPHRLPLAGVTYPPASAGPLRLRVRHLIEMGKLPFDLAEAEQELQEGPLTEYSGYGFAVLKCGASALSSWWSCSVCWRLLPVGQMTHFSRWGDCYWPWWLPRSSCLVGVLVIALLKTAWRVCALSRPRASPGPVLVLHF